MSGRLIVTDKPLQVTNLQGCVVVTTAPIISGAYITDCLILSHSDVTVGSYLAGSTVISTANVQVGSYSEANTIQARQVAVGSTSRGSTYYNVKPFVGKPGCTDPSHTSDVFNALFE